MRRWTYTAILLLWLVVGCTQHQINHGEASGRAPSASDDATRCEDANDSRQPLASALASTSPRPDVDSGLAQASSSAAETHSIHIFSGTDSCGRVWMASINLTISQEPQSPESRTPQGTRGSHAAGSEYEVVDISVFSGGAAPYPLKPAQFEFLSRSGGVFEPMDATSTKRFGQPLPKAVLRTGDWVGGVLVYEVPVGGGEVVLSDGAGVEMKWKVDA